MIQQIVHRLVTPDLQAAIPLGTADANGRIVTHHGYSVHLSNAYGQSVLYTQIHALDRARSEIAAALDDARRSLRTGAEELAREAAQRILGRDLA